MREQIEAMREIWTKTKPEYHGETVDFPPMMTWPKPVQNPLPVIVGGAFPHAARRAVRYGNGWAPIAGRAPYGDIDDYLPKFKAMLSEAGRKFEEDRKSTRLNSSHVSISYAVFCLKKKTYIAKCQS